MKYWSFWYFWSILLLTTVLHPHPHKCVTLILRSLSIKTRGATQSRTTTFCLAPAPRPPVPLAGPVVLATVLGWAAASEHTQQAGQWHISAPTPLLDHDLQRMSEAVSSVCRAPGILRQPEGKAFLSLAAWRKTISMSYSLIAWYCHLDSQRWQKWSLQCL